MQNKLHHVDPIVLLATKRKKKLLKISTKVIIGAESTGYFVNPHFKYGIIGEKEYIDGKVEERVQEKDEEYERMLDSSNFIERIIFHQDPAERRSKAKSEIIEELLKSKEEDT